MARPVVGETHEALNNLDDLSWSLRRNVRPKRGDVEEREIRAREGDRAGSGPIKLADIPGSRIDSKSEEVRHGPMCRDPIKESLVMVRLGCRVACGASTKLVPPERKVETIS